MSDILMFAGLAGLVVGLIAAMKGSLPKLHLTSRKQAGALMVAGFVAMMAGGAFADPLPKDPASVPSPPIASQVTPMPTLEPEFALAPLVEPPSPEPSSVDQSSGSIAKSTSPKQPVAAPARKGHVGASEPAGAGCDSHYPDFCIALGPPDLDCPEIGRNNFTVLPPDPHRFDADHDGLGCDKAVPAQPGPPAPAPAPPIPPPAPADTECSDGIDNDGDGDVDGADSGCESLGDDSEAGPALPPPPPPPPPSPPVPPPGDECDPSYPGVCIAPAPPDLDCPQVPYDNFAVVGSDPHGFDADNDGVGCET